MQGSRRHKNDRVSGTVYDSRLHKSLDVKIEEKKREIINSIVLKKIKKQVQIQTELPANPETIKNHIDSIAKTTFSPFKSLKGLYNKKLAEEYYKALSGNQGPGSEGFLGLNIKQEVLELEDSKILIDYLKIEHDLLGELARNFEATIKVSKKRGTLVVQNDQLSQEIKYYQGKVKPLES